MTVCYEADYFGFCVLQSEFRSTAITNNLNGQNVANEILPCHSDTVLDLRVVQQCFLLLSIMEDFISRH